MQATGARPTVNLKFFFEGEEEAGSPHLAAALERYDDLLRTDLWLLCDGPVHQSRRPQLFFGARGVLGLEITVYGPTRTLHSGHYGNWAPNPAALLAQLLASMRDEDGRITIAGYDDDVRPLTETERAAIAAMPDVDAALRQELRSPPPKPGRPAWRAASCGPRSTFAASSRRTSARGAERHPHRGARVDRLPAGARPDAATVRERCRGPPARAGLRRHRRRARRSSGSRATRWSGSTGAPATRRRARRSTCRCRAAPRRVVGAARRRARRRAPTLGGSIPMYLFRAAPR